MNTILNKIIKAKRNLLLILIALLSQFSILNAQTILITNGTASQCSGEFYDTGGLVGNYSINEDITFTLSPNIAGNFVSLLFTQFVTEDNYDGLMIYDGPNTSSPIISSGLPAGLDPINCPAGSWRGTTNPGTITSSHPSGSLTFVFKCDGTTTLPGWSANVSCIPPCVLTFADNNFKQALLNDLTININSDLEIQCDEATDFSGVINVQGQSISNLSGIELFVNATGLNCSNNQITSLDVSSLNLLSSISCNNNSLTTLDAGNGNNTNFTVFNAINNPNLVCVDVDNSAYMNANWGSAIDATANYSGNCALNTNFTSNITTVCQGGTAIFASSSTGTTGSAIYFWDFGNGQTANTVGPHSIIYNTVGNFTVSLTINDGETITQTRTDYITVIPNVVPSISIVASQTSVCEGKQVFFTASPSNAGQAPAFQWKINGLDAGTNSPIFSSSTLPNNSIVKCILVSSELCSSPSSIASNEITITINQNAFDPDFTVSQAVFSEPPFEVNFTNTTPNSSNYTFKWFFGDGSTSSLNSPTHEYLNYLTANYTVTLVAQNSEGCVKAIVKPNHINCTSVSTNCNFTRQLNYTGTINGCQGGSLALKVTTNAQNPIFQWMRNGENIGGATQNQYLAKTAGVYNVIVYENQGCPAISESVTVNFNNPPPPTPIILQNGQLLPCEPQNSVVLTASNVTGANSLLWNTGETTNAITINQSWYYTVKATYLAGCDAKSLPLPLSGSNAPNPGICIVTVDTVTNNRNLISWQKPITNEIDSFIIFRETDIFDVFSKAGSVAYEDLSEFIDPNINIQSKGYRYAISSLDTCGSYSLPSVIHKTIHSLTFPGNGINRQLSWSAYEGIDFSNYLILRKLQQESLFSIIDTVSSIEQIYTDTSLPDENTATSAEYKVNIFLNSVCVSTLRSSDMTAARSRSHSNQNGNNYILPTVVGLKDLSILDVKIKPNPSDGLFVLEFNTITDNTFIEVSDVFGRIVLQNVITDNNHYIDLSSFSKGMYFVKLQAKNNKIQLHKLVLK
jgi:PKD repeat protein